MTEATEIANRYIAVWNEAEPTRRKAMIVEGWTDGATYVDPLASVTGCDEISELIGGVQARFPGFRFALDGQADGYANKVRFSWRLGPESEPDMIKGTDFAIIEGNQLASVTGFLDKVPPAP